jgi:sigma-54 dependent transcriptional regulator, acetoin dehydrogenase operon transcriptional activator AcoR
MYRILIKSYEEAGLAFIAQSLAREIAPGNIEIFTPNTPSTNIPKIYQDVISELNLVLEDNNNQIEDETSLIFDVIITIGSDQRIENPLYQGLPIMINWETPNSEVSRDNAENTIESLRNIRDILKQRTEHFFQQDYINNLIQLNRTYRNLFDSMSDAVIAQNNGRVFFLNKAAEKILGYSASEIVGQSCDSLIPSEFCNKYCDKCSKNSLVNSLSNHPIKLERENQEALDLEISVHPIHNPDGLNTGTIIIMRDMTKTKRIQLKSTSEKGFYGIIGTHPSMEQIYETIKHIADMNVPVLIQGENGTGKELVANAIHQLGNRSSKPFVPLNCSAIPDGLFESELFGHVKGAFTSAIRDKKGRFELASRGILFLDEVGEIPLHLQVKLLRILQEKSFYPVGSEKQLTTDARIVCATNRDLKSMMSDGSFREDLFYRLNVIPIKVPPLRERRSDITLLIKYYMRRYSVESGVGYKRIDPEVYDVLHNHDWPGNVRELANVIQYTLIHTRSNTIEVKHLPASINNARKEERRGRKPKLKVNDINRALKQFEGNKASAAESLGISRTTLYRYLGNIK